MGSQDFYPEEQPLRQVKVDPFWIDETPVTNEQFATFIEATGHRTTAEIPPDPKDYPGLDPELAFSGSLVFHKTTAPVRLDDWSQWWHFVKGADWRHPIGADGEPKGLGKHPVVHVTHADATAYAAWAGKNLPSEAEWEFAAQGGHDDGRPYSWGYELMPNGEAHANFWQGEFPHENSLEDGWERTSPVRSYAPNAYGLYDMIGNVWEWTDDWYGAHEAHAKPHPTACCTIDNPRGGSREQSLDPRLGALKIPRRVIKGGSHLCAENYCKRYRPAARQGQDIDSSTSHIGFRCVVRMS